MAMTTNPRKLMTKYVPNTEHRFSASARSAFGESQAKVPCAIDQKRKTHQIANEMVTSSTEIAIILEITFADSIGLGTDETNF